MRRREERTRQREARESGDGEVERARRRGRVGKKSGDAERVDSDRGLCASEWGSERCARGQYGKVGNILYVRNVVHENVKRLIKWNG